MKGEWLRRMLRTLGIHVRRHDPTLPEIWSHDPEFLKILEEISGRTLVAQDRLFMLFQLARLTAPLPGAMAEVGVYRGGTARLLARACPQKALHLFDTFSGMPQADPSLDRHHQGDFADTSLAEVKEYLADCPRLHFHPGLFPASAASLPPQPYALVYLDVDLYHSTKDGLEYFYPMLVKGGAIVCDDYEWKGCPGVKKALDEFLAGKPEKVFVTARYQCAIIKS